MKFARMAALPLLIAACTSGSPTRNGLPAPSDNAAKSDPGITEADLKQRLYAVAHDSMIGRATGTIGHIKVTDYIASEMKRMGLQPGGENGTYFQSVPFLKRVVKEAVISVDGETFKLWDDFVPIHPGAAFRSIDNVPVIFGGIAQDTTKMITREQAAGKFVVLINPTQNPFARGANPRGRLETAAGVLTINSPNALELYRGAFRNPGPAYMGGPQVTGDRGIPMVGTAAMAEKLMGIRVDATTTVGTPGKTVRGRITYTEEPVVARNVIAILPGSDAALKNTYVAIGAHSDHDPIEPAAVDHDSLRAFNALVRARHVELGRDVTEEERAQIKVNLDSLRALRPVRRDSIKNGADDDGSGTVAVLEIAEAMAGAREKPKRSMLFVWHVAEELGLFGSNHYTEHPTVPRDSIIAQLNIDMIGRGGPREEKNGGPDYLQLIGWRRLSNQLGDVIDAVNKQQPQPFKFDLQYDAAGHPEQYYCRSDHYMYARYGIPVAFFSTGNHGDYHEVTDEPQYIDYTKLRNVTQLIHDVGKAVANLPTRPVVDGPKPDPRGQCRQ
ncbi:MAG TPA: M28 family peptidase [Longimicrobiales bacterium]